MSKYTLAPQAQTDLEGIWKSIAKNNEIAADKLIRKLAQMFELLATQKEMGTRQDQFVVDMRMFPFRGYNIYHFPTEDGIEIYRVLHGARNIEADFENFFEGLEK